MNTIPTGIPGFDPLLYGGLTPGSCTLVEGVPGAGKTTFGLAFIYYGITEFDQPGVVVTFEQFPEQMYHDAAKFGWNLPILEKQNQLRIICTSPELLNEDGETPSFLEEAIREIGAKRLLVDSITHFQSIIPEEIERRRAVYSFRNALKRMGLTSVFVKEIQHGNELIPFEEYVVDGVIRLTNSENSNRQRNRFVEILKTRGQAHISGKHSFTIGQQGIEVFSVKALLRGREEITTEVRPSTTGIKGLDELLQGGFPGGTCTVVAGGAGTGKTILGFQFLVEGAISHREKGVYLSLEEHPDQIINNSGGFTWNLGEIVREGWINIFHSPPVDLNIDEIILRLGGMVKESGASRVVVDSLPALVANISDSSLIREKIFCLFNYLSSLGCTTLILSNLSEKDENGRFGVDESLANGTIFLKSTMERNRRIRYVEIYKMRGIKYVTGNHLMEIGRNGVQVFPRLREV